jgi:hypothetical protein
VGRYQEKESPRKFRRRRPQNICQALVNQA